MVGETLSRITDPTQAMQLLWLVPALPLAASAINLFIGRRLGKGAGYLATGAVLASFLVAIAAVRGLIAAPEDGRLYVLHLYDWISSGAFQVGVDLRLDALSATMILVVTGIGSLIHLYANGYMAGDPRFGRFFAYLNLFVFFMLMLVLGQNYLVMYVGWEGVGLCSYLLIGFWYEKTENANAAKKAFVVTRVGDTGLLIGLALIVMKFGTLDFSVIFGAAPTVLTSGAATAIALLLFAGAIGKSAQIPLQVWLPDAMAGPTPVSALIHAATMVTAGVYLVVRSHVVFDLSPVAPDVVAIVGLITLLLAGTAALAQTDIKRVLAYSTVSQLGYMFLAAGLKAYAVAIFFLVAHAFYKALLFLGAGSVIHGMHEEQDLTRMGGLWRRMPITAVTMVIGALALAGVPPLAGFFAKDIVLEVANATGRTTMYVLASVGVLFSALYIGRLISLTFFGKPRSEAAEHAHESPPVFWIPLALLASGAVFAGLLSLGAEGILESFLEPLVGAVPRGAGGLPTGTFYVVALTITAVGLVSAWWIYGSGRVDWAAMRERLQPLPRTLEAGWYIDNLYSAVLVGPGKAAARAIAFWFDEKVIDGFVNAIGAGAKRAARGGRLIQTGYVRTYALVVFLGAVLVLAYVGVRA